MDEKEIFPFLQEKLFHLDIFNKFETTGRNVSKGIKMFGF